MYIAIAGNIGSGKTTLAQLLSKYYKWGVYYEDNKNNPYLTSFYDDMQRWAFNLQVYFLNNRFKKILEITKSEKTVLQDRTIYEDAKIFAPNLHEMGLMSGRDYETYLSMFNLLDSLIKPPDLILYLRATVPTLVKQIQKRGRNYESSIRIDYLNNLNNRYEEWIEGYDKSKLLIFDVDKLNIMDNPADFGEIVNSIDTKLHGLFND